MESLDSKKVKSGKSSSKKEVRISIQVYDNNSLENYNYPSLFPNPSEIRVYTYDSKTWQKVK